MIKQLIASQVEQVLKDLGVLDISVQVDYPKDASHGDYASNVALVAAKKLGKSPIELAKQISEKLTANQEELASNQPQKNQPIKILNKVDVAGPGFLNFWIADEFLVETVDTVRSNKKQKDTDKGVFAGKKIVVEYTDPNPFKELHIGHLYSNIIGESLSRIFEANGAEVRRVDYYGDVGMHVAKSLWGIMKLMDDRKVSLNDLEKLSLTERITFLGEGYALGSNAFADDPNVAEEVKDINYLVYMSGQEYQQKKYGWKPQIDYKKYLRPEKASLYETVKEIYEKGKDWSLENFENLYVRLGTKFDGYYPESIAGERGYKIVKENIENGVFVESEGAVIFPGEKYGLHNRVFINKLGLPTYEAKELGLAPWKYEEFKYDLSFIVTATEIAGYFGVLMAALKKVNPELGEKTIPMLHGMVKLPEGKMSSRSGNVITVTWLLDEAKQQAMLLSNDPQVAETVGVGAIKYALLKNGIGKDVEFNFEESISFEGNSGPYLQYTFARTQSVLAKAESGEQRAESSIGALSSKPSALSQEERQLLRLLVRFDEIVEEAAVRYAPSTVATYLFELAQAFNLFYQKHSILKPARNADVLATAGGDEELVKDLRLALTEATGTVLKKGLYLLGISAPEKM